MYTGRGTRLRVPQPTNGAVLLSEAESVSAPRSRRNPAFSFGRHPERRLFYPRSSAKIRGCFFEKRCHRCKSVSHRWESNHAVILRAAKDPVFVFGRHPWASFVLSAFIRENPWLLFWKSVSPVQIGVTGANRCRIGENPTTPSSFAQRRIPVFVFGRHPERRLFYPRSSAKIRGRS